MSATNLRGSYQPLPTTMDNPILTRSVEGSVGGSSSSNSGSISTDVERLDDTAVGLPATNSTHQLMPTEEMVQPQANRPRLFMNASRSQWFSVAVLCFVNLINYMDRFTIAGVLTEIQEDFQIGDDDGGLLQTAFVFSYMVCAPIFGYLGDRYSRRFIMAAGVLVWSTTTLLGSFMHSFGWFIAFRALVGIGEASYSTIAPTIISDLFVSDMRSKMLAVFYFAIPVGSGMGYIIGSETAHMANNWRWALRVTPILGVIAVVLLLMIKDPVRGESEGSHNMQATSFKEDIKALSKNHSFMLSTIGFTCVAFVTGALAWWGPKFIYLGLKMQQGNEDMTLNGVAFVFGAITMCAGLLGVPLGSILSQRLVKRYPHADPLLCFFGLLISTPLMCCAMIIVSSQTVATYVLIFFGQLALNLNWAIVADILLYVVVPTRRSTAEAFQILISHAFGDAGSPYFVGLLSEAIKKHLRTASPEPQAMLAASFQPLSLTLENATSSTMGANLTQAVANITTSLIETTTTATASVLSNVTQELGSFTLNLGDQDTNLTKFKALQYALFSTCFVEFLGGVFFLITAAYIVRDKRKAAEAVRDAEESAARS